MFFCCGVCINNDNDIYQYDVWELGCCINDGTKGNCASCAIAYDMRLRYDDIYPTAINERCGLTRKGMASLFEGNATFKVVNVDNVYDYISEHYPIGSFGMISGHYYDSSGKQIGHVFNWVNCTDGVIVIDSSLRVATRIPQSFISDTYYNVALLRTDNLEYKVQIADYVNLLGDNYE